MAILFNVFNVKKTRSVRIVKEVKKNRLETLPDCKMMTPEIRHDGFESPLQHDLSDANIRNP